MKGSQKPVLAVDLGGTKIRAGIVGRNFRILRHTTIPTPTNSSVAVLNALLELIYTFDKKSYDHVAIAFAGLTTWPDGEILTAPSLPMVTNIPLRRYLQDVLRRPVVVDNDATLWTLGEAVSGAGRRFSRVAGLILGTGIGGGYIVDKNIPRTKDNITEFGHMTIAMGGPTDQHGGQGHLEAFAGGWAISRAYHRITGRSIAAKDIAQRARNHDRVAEKVINHAARAVTAGLENIINLLNPDIIILGGSVSKAPGLVSRAKQDLRQRLLHSSLQTPIVIASHGDDAPLIGAAHLAWSK